MCDLSWEKFLTKEQYVFQYHESIPISTLHWDANAARLGRKLDHQHVESLVLSEADEMLPAPTFARRPDLPDSDMAVIDGVHRMEAKTHEAARRTHTDGYEIINASDYRLSLLSELANIRNGKGVSYEDRLRQAADKFRRFPGVHGLTELARLYHVEKPKNALSDHVALEQVTTRAFGLGVQSVFDRKVAQHPISQATQRPT